MAASATTRHGNSRPAACQRGAASRIGPNAVTRLAAAVEARFGKHRLQRIFDDAGLSEYGRRPPTEMVDEAEVIRLHRGVREDLGYEAYRDAARLAGQMTGDYLLACRIPSFARWLLPRLPDAVAARLLNRAMARNAWTFVGSGRFHARYGRRGPQLIIEDSPLARGLSLRGPVCDYYAATFERLYQRLVGRRLILREQCCVAQGASFCRFAASERGLADL